MATRQSTRIATAGTQPKGLRVGLVAVTGTYSLPAAGAAGASRLSAADIIQMVKVPAGANLIYLRNQYSAPGSCTFTIGDTASTARYVSSLAIASADSGTQVINVVTAPYTYSVDSTIDITVASTSVQSAGTGVGGFIMHAIFSMDSGPNT